MDNVFYTDGDYFGVIDNIENCPCSGKNMSNLAAPWILLTLYHHQGLHGYAIEKIIKGHIEEFSMGLNITGLYRHLNMLEQRGVLLSKWDTRRKGPARRCYYLTESGEECLWRWLNTLSTQVMLIGRFFDQARKAFPASHLPTVRLEKTPAT